MSEPKTFEQAFAEICAMESPLGDRLTALTGIIKTFGPEFDTAYDALVAQLRTGNAGANAPGVGDQLPGYLLTDQHGKLVDLQALYDQGPVVVSLNRGHWCEYCELELGAFTKAHEEFAAAGATVVSIMPERMEYTRRVSERCRRAFSILSDIDNSYALELNLVVWLGDDVRRLLSGSGLDLAKYQGNSSWFVPIPATFVTDTGGRVSACFVDPDFRRRMDIDAILAALVELRAASPA